MKTENEIAEYGKEIEQRLANAKSMGCNEVLSRSSQGTRVGSYWK